MSKQIDKRWVENVEWDKLESTQRLPKGFLKAVCETESQFDAMARSPVGAVGAFQFMPLTASDWGLVDRTDPIASALAASKMYGWLFSKFSGDIVKALAAYNWGYGNVINKGMNAMPEETKNYISRVTSAMPKYA